MSNLILPILTQANPEYKNYMSIFQSHIGKENTHELVRLMHPAFLYSNRYKESHNLKMLIDSLKDMYILDFIEDLTHRYVFNDIAKGFPVQEITKISKESFIGFTMEAFVIRKINDECNNVVKKHVYKWLHGLDNVPSDAIVENIEAIGRGSLHCIGRMPDEYNVLSKMDIVLAKHENNLYTVMHNGSRSLELQIKAVKSMTQVMKIRDSLLVYALFMLGYEIDNIYKITKSNTMLNSKKIYRNTLSLLRFDGRIKNHIGIHTSEYIKQSVKRELSKHGLFYDVDNIIKSPESVGLSQHEIDEYYELLSYFYDYPEEFSYANIDKNIKNSLLFLSLTKTEPIKHISDVHNTAVQHRRGIIIS